MGDLNPEVNSSNVGLGKILTASLFEVSGPLRYLVRFDGPEYSKLCVGYVASMVSIFSTLLWFFVIIGVRRIFKIQ